MTAPRTQGHRAWVWVELVPSGTSTGGTYIDLNLVDKVNFGYSPDKDAPNGRAVDVAEIVYAGTLKPLILGNFPHQNVMGAQWFHDTWNDYIKNTCKSFIAEMPPGKPGLIEVPKDTKLR